MIDSVSGNRTPILHGARRFRSANEDLHTPPARGARGPAFELGRLIPGAQRPVVRVGDAQLAANYWEDIFGRHVRMTNGESERLAYYDLWGNDSDNLIVGNGGNDTLDGGVGHDLLQGGVGDDRLILMASPDSAASPWVREEIRVWLTKDPTASRVLIALTDGEIATTANSRGIDGAATDAALVPAGFIKYATYDEAPGRRTNRVQTINQLTRHASIDPRFRNLTVGGVADPRVNVTDSGFKGSDGATALWITRKYQTPGADIPLAKWEEAQLIIAEARGGAEAVAAINRLRDVHGLPHFTGSSASEIRAAILEERSRVLFLEGRRIGDLVGYAELSFQTGLTHKGNSYNDDLTCLPLPNAEENNNPNI